MIVFSQVRISMWLYAEVCSLSSFCDMAYYFTFALKNTRNDFLMMTAGDEADLPLKL